MNNNAIEIDDLLKPEKRYISGKKMTGLIPGHDLSGL
jgi:hypothetical protein